MTALQVFSLLLVILRCGNISQMTIDSTSIVLVGFFVINVKPFAHIFPAVCSNFSVL